MDENFIAIPASGLWFSFPTFPPAFDELYIPNWAAIVAQRLCTTVFDQTVFGADT